MAEIPVGLLGSLAASPAIVRTLLRGVEPAASRQAEPGEWPATVILAHLADVDGFMVAALERILGEPDATVGDYDPIRTGERPEVWTLALADALERFAETRARYVARLDGLSADEWSLPVIHERDGPLTVASFTGRILHHDIAHISQLCRLIG